VRLTILVLGIIITRTVQLPSRISNNFQFNTCGRIPASPNAVIDLGLWQQLAEEACPYVWLLSLWPLTNMNFQSIRGEGPRYYFSCELCEPLTMYQMLIIVGVILAKSNGKSARCRCSSSQGMSYCYVSLTALVHWTTGYRLVSWTLPETSIHIHHLNIFWREYPCFRRRRVEALPQAHRTCIFRCTRLMFMCIMQSP